MPRDGAGNYTLPAGNPVAPNTDIEASWANDTMDDIASALTDSLSRTGSGGMLSPFQFANGSQGSPSVTFTSEPNSGLYRAGSEDVRMSVASTDVTRWVNGNFQKWDTADTIWKNVATENSRIRFADGVVTEPSVSFQEEQNLGLYREDVGEVRWAYDDGPVFRFIQDNLQKFYEAAVTGTGKQWYDLLGQYLTSSQRPDVDDNNDNVADTNFVRKWANAVAQGVGDGNSSTILGDSFGVASWIKLAGVGSYTITLANNLTNANNAVVHVNPIDTSSVTFMTRVRITGLSTILVEVADDTGASIDPDAIGFTVFDTGLHV